MNERRFTWPYLESLTTGELIALADSLDIDIPPDLERIFIIEELLEIEAVLNPEELLEEADIPEPSPLPKQYNSTFINTLIRDPLWVFIFWEIKTTEREIYEKSLDFKGYFLQVTGISRDVSFTIPVGILDNAWYLGFPPEGGRFFVEICAQRGEAEVVLGVSKAFQLPPLFNRPKEGDIHNQLSLLSGLGDLNILQNEDRLPYIPQYME